MTWSMSPALGTIDNAGLYTAPPSVASNTTVTVTAASTLDSTKLGTATLTLTPFTPTLGISSRAALPDAALNSSYSQSLVAIGGTPPYSWTVQSSPPSALPDGLTLSSGGVLSGTPAAAGSYSFTLAVADSGSPPQSASQLFSTTIGTMPDMGQMAVLELFVLRHSWLTDPSASGASANGGLYGLPDDDLSTVNSLVATAAQQLAQVQSQASTYTDGFAYLNTKNAALQNLNTQVQSRVAPASRQKLSDYMSTLSRTSSESLDSSAQTLATVAPNTCSPGAANCLYMWSEINFFNGGGSNYGLGTRLDSFVQGVNARDFTSWVKNFVLQYCLPNNGACSNVSTWDDRSASNGGSAASTWTVADPQRGTYVVTGKHAFENRSVRMAPPFTNLLNAEAQPEYGSWSFHTGDGLNTYQTQVDLGFKIGTTKLLGATQTYDVYSCTSPITVSAYLVPPLPAGNQAPPLSWSGGNRVNDLTRTIPCNPGNVTLSLSLGRNLTSSLTVRVHAQPTVSVSPATASGKPWDVLTFTATGSAEGGTFRWSTDNSDVIWYVRDCASGSTTCQGSPSATCNGEADENGQVTCTHDVQIRQPGTAHVTVLYTTAHAASSPASAQVSATYYTISGRVTTPDGNGVSGITVDPQMNIRTGADGNYRIAVAAGGSYAVTPNDLSGTYWFSPRNATFTNINSNQTANFTATPVTYVYLIHGIGQTATAMAGLKANLQDPSVGVDLDRYHIDASFTFECATSCGGACSVQPGQTLVNLGAQRLGSYIQIQQPPGNIILVGYSMGGLIARDLVANNYAGALTGHPVTALITLGTPNLGYPYASIDENVNCRQLLLDMSGSWGQTTSGWNELTSPYLDGLRQMWVTRSYTVPWMAAAGESCSNMTRNLPLGSTVGCPSWSPASDGVVCRDSAQYGGPVSGYGYFNDGPKPYVPWVDTAGVYVHTNSFAGWGTAGILCGNSGDPSLNPQMFDPPKSRSLFPQIKAVISAH